MCPHKIIYGVVITDIFYLETRPFVNDLFEALHSNSYLRSSGDGVKTEVSDVIVHLLFAIY